MEHESFEDPATAAVMNERFVNVKVDREERPDVDSVYMDAVVALSGHGGWPMTVFLTPDGEPFFGGTYYPPEPRHGLPSFRAGARSRSRTRTASGAPTSRGRRARSSRPCVTQSEQRPSDGAAHRAGPGGRRSRAARAVRPGVGRVRARAEVPAGLRARVPPAPRRARRS